MISKKLAETCIANRLIGRSIIMSVCDCVRYVDGEIEEFQVAIHGKHSTDRIIKLLRDRYGQTTIVKNVMMDESYYYFPIKTFLVEGAAYAESKAGAKDKSKKGL